MEKAIRETQKNFESSSIRTPEYLRWHHLFKRQLKTFLLEYGITVFNPSKPNHFDFSAFFQTPAGQWFYVSVSDLRGFKDSMLIRTAKHEKDFTGGVNRYCGLNNECGFRRNFEEVTGLYKS